jgi:hypothetical protein
MQVDQHFVASILITEFQNKISRSDIGRCLGGIAGCRSDIDRCLA